MATLHEAFVEELRDIYDAEKQLTDALPKMAKAASEDKLRNALEHHLKQTRQHVERLEDVFKDIDASRDGVTCEAMKGLVKEGEDVMKEHDSGPVRDAMLIAAAQRVEHYEMAAYGTVCAWAEAMGHDAVAERLRETLDEEKHADEKLNEIAMDGVNRAAMS